MSWRPIIHRRLLGLLVTGLVAASAAFAARPSDEDVLIAQSLAEMLRAARTVVSDNQDLINNPEIGNKHLTGQAVVDRAVEGYAKATGADPTAVEGRRLTTATRRTIDPNSREGRLLHAMMAAIATVMEDNQATINEKGTGFKGFIPATFTRLVDEEFNRRAKGEAVMKFTAPPELVRNRKALPDAWEADVINTKLLGAGWPKGQAYSTVVDTNGRPAFRVLIPEYYVASCLACHGSPKGELDITGYPKEGGKIGDLGGATSITLYH